MNENEMLQDDEINLYDLVQPLLENWKLIAVTALLGVLAGAAGWWVKGYEAELKAKPVAQLDFVEWRRIAAGLPALAESRVTSSGDAEALYRMLGNSVWWTKNVTPQYRYSKNDLKDIGAIPKEDQERGATIIESVVFRGKSIKQSDAVAQAVGAERFVREGGLLLVLKSIVERRNLESHRISADVQAVISRNEVELGYLQKRAAVLKKLAQQYPDKQGSSLQSVLDPKGDSARYLPIGTQLIAVETEINGLEESLSRARDRLEEVRVSGAFVERALPLLKSDPDGFSLAKNLEAIEGELRKGVDPANKAQMAAINDIARELNSTHERFKSLFETDSLVAAQRSAGGMLLALGLVGGLLAGVMAVLFVDAWRRAKEQRRAAS